MRPGPAIALSVLLLSCAAGAVAARQTGTNPIDTGGTAATTTGTAAATTPAKAPKHKAAAKCSYKGEVSVVGDNTFTVHPAKGDDVVLKVNDKTKYYPKGKSWADVKVGAKVWGVCHKDGADTWAVTVHFTAEKAAKTPAAAKTNPSDTGGTARSTGGTGGTGTR
jgi:hypothetical protein